MKVTSKIWVSAVLAVLSAFTLSQLHGAEKGPTVFAAASLKNALDDVAADWRRKTGRKPVIVYGATPALANQITQGAEADIFISADLDWMDDLDRRGLIDEASRIGLVSNDLVLIVPKGSTLSTGIEPGFQLARLLGDGRLAIASVKAVPAGRYGKAALENLEVWDQVKNQLAEADNVRAALRLVSRGEAPLGIVYGSDAKADSNVTVLGVFPNGSHKPIVYPAARLRDAAPQASGAFFAYLTGPEAAKTFIRHGFGGAPTASPEASDQ